MPIFMDRHDIPGVTAEDVAEAHKEDLKIQDKYNCRALTYWFDEEAGMAFCLIEAPNKEAVQRLHNYAHGLIPNQIIEVEPEVVRSFLGRIEDPDEAENSAQNIINDPAFRSIMVVTLDESLQLHSRIPGKNDKPSLRDFTAGFRGLVEKYQGAEVEHGSDCFMASFSSVTQSVLCARALQTDHTNHNGPIANGTEHLKIGLSAGVPVTDDNAFFGQTKKLARHLGLIARPGSLVLSSLVGELSREHTSHPHNGSLTILNPSEEDFLSQMMEVVEARACNPDFDVNRFGSALGMSKSQLYRKLTSLLGFPPNDFIREYRLKLAFKLLQQQHGNISEIAFASGFSSLSYFSKCFVERFHILPSDCAKAFAS